MKKVLCKAQPKNRNKDMLTADGIQKVDFKTIALKSFSLFPVIIPKYSMALRMKSILSPCRITPKTSIIGHSMTTSIITAKKKGAKMYPWKITTFARNTFDHT